MGLSRVIYINLSISWLGDFMVKDLRSFLAKIEKIAPEEIIRVKKEVDPKYEITAIIFKLEQQRRVPILIFENVKGAKFPVVTNVYSTRRRIASSIDVEREKLMNKYINAIDNPISPKVVSNGPVKDIVLKDEEVNLQLLPQTVYHIGEAPYITAGIVVAKDPETGIRNASYNRLMIKDKDKLGILMGAGKHLRELYDKAEERDKPLEVAICIGNHPTWAIGSLFPGPFGVDEYRIIEGLLGEPLEVVKCTTIDVEVPSHAEMVLEGEILPYVREDEGPFGEFTGYATGKGKRAVVKVKAITHRKEAIYQIICGGAHREHLVMATVPIEANFHKSVKAAVPSLKAVHAPAPFTVFISIKKRLEGQPKNAMLAAFSGDMYLKHAVVVDEDVDVNNVSEVLWAIATHVQADRDIFIIPGARGSEVDPSSRGGLTAKMGVDATTKPSIREFAPRNRLPKDIMERIVLADYLKK